MTRQELEAKGKAMRERLLGPGAPEVGGGYDQFAAEAIFGGIWNRPGLDFEARMICTLASLSALERLDHLRRHIAAAVRAGMQPQTMIEVFIQCGLYAGFPTAENAIAVTREVLAEHGIDLPAPERRTDSLEELSRRGRDLLQRLHGERGSQGYASADNPVTGALYPTAIQYGYGELWFRPGLDMRQRALCAVAAFTALRMESQVRKFGQSALNAGLSREEIIEAIIQTGPYSGFPGALNALAALSDALRG